MITTTVAATLAAGAMAAPSDAAPRRHRRPATPIEHVVVVFQENVSFDHYFATYPVAENRPGETPFVAAAGTQPVNGLTPELLTANPNLSNPHRLSPGQALTCDQDHDYADEQAAFNGGAMDRFVEKTSRDVCSAPAFGEPGLVMDYFDGNTVTALWNYAQHYAMSDNSFNTTFGPSTPGALNLVSGQTGNAVDHARPGSAPFTVTGDPQPAFDDCGSGSVELTGRNVGDLLNDNGVTWGWFQGGFRPTVAATADSRAVCGAASPVGQYTHGQQTGGTTADYAAHHEPFQYYRSTANPHHLPPSSPAMIGRTDQANHQYDLADFDTALAADRLPAVSFVKAPRALDGHAGYSSPLDEQHFIVDTINKIQTSKAWRSTAVVIAYDDSDGWYDHQAAPVVNGSACDQRCGYGPRLPLLVVSPWSRVNTVDHTLTDQTSILRFIEDNWHTGRIGGGSFDEIAGPLDGMFDFHGPKARAVTLDPTTGTVVHRPRHRALNVRT